MTTKPLQIKNTAPAVSFLVNQIGSVTPREQVIRELVENAKQACLNRLKIEPEMAGKLPLRSQAHASAADNTMISRASSAITSIRIRLQSVGCPGGSTTKLRRCECQTLPNWR